MPDLVRRRTAKRRIEKERACGPSSIFGTSARELRALPSARGALSQSAKTLLVLTPAYTASGWAESTNVMAQTLSPSNRDLRLIPLLKESCDKPLRVAALTHIDFQDNADQHLAWRQLLTALGSPPPLEIPKGPDVGRWLCASPITRMPPNFTGRWAERRALDDWLAQDGVHPVLVLRALGGFGKSALAWHWVQTHDVPAVKSPRVAWWSLDSRRLQFRGLPRRDRWLLAIRAARGTKDNRPSEPTCSTYRPAMRSGDSPDPS